MSKQLYCLDIDSYSTNLGSSLYCAYKMYWDKLFSQKLCTTFTTYPTWKTLLLAAVK